MDQSSELAPFASLSMLRIGSNVKSFSEKPCVLETRRDAYLMFATTATRTGKNRRIRSCRGCPKQASLDI